MLTIFNKKPSQGFKLSNLNVGLVVMLTLVGMLSPLIVNTRKAYADDKLRASTQEQQNRTKARALVRCLETSDIYIPDDHVAKARLPNRDVSVGHEIASDDGNMSCDQFFDEFKGMVGIKDNVDLANRIMKDGNSTYAIVDNNKREQLENEWISKLEEYANQRSPMIKSEELRRLRTAIGVCADATDETVPNNNKDAYFEIDGDRFKYKEGPSKWVALGHDYWDEDGDGGERCGAIVERAMAVKAFSQEADDIIAYEAQCITEGAADINACIAQKVATQGHGDPGGGDSGGGGGEKTKVECDTISWNPLKWFLCPVILIAEKAVDALDKLITYMLTFPTKAYFDNNAGMQQAWSRFRNLSIGLLLIAGLVMVISQAIGTGPFDAYTIKRVMPRMLFAVVFISISWSVLRIMIEFTNIAGVGVRNLIETAFGSESFGNITFNNGSMSIGVLTGAGMGLSLGFMGILSLLGTALLGVLIAFVVLAMRQMVIIMLVILAPVAIACYILPNTEKVWKMWWDFFIRAIFAFPIISMFIAVGHAFAAISANSTTVEGGDAVLKDTIASLIAFAAYFGPYFALPYAFKLAGGAVAQIGGVVNDRSRGAFDRMKNYRKQKTAQNMSDWAHGDRFSSNNVLARGVNRVGIGAKSGWKGRFGMGERGEKARARIMQAGADATLASNKELEGFLNRDDDGAAVLGLSGGTSRGAREAAADLRRTWIANGTSEAEATARADRALAAASAMGVNRQNAGAAWTKMAQNKSRAIPAGDIETIQRGSQRLAGGNATAAQEMAWSQQFHSRGAGRVAEGGDWTSTEVQGHLDAAANARQAGNNALADHHTFEAQRATFMDGVKRTGVGSLTSGHSSATAMANQVIQEGLTSADPTRRLESATLLSELAGQLPGATGENRDNIAGALLAAGIDPNLVESAGKAPVAIGTNPDGSIIYQMQNQDAAVSIDQQLVRIVNAPIPGIPGGATGTVTTKDLDVIKRSWGSTPPGARTT